MAEDLEPRFHSLGSLSEPINESNPAGRSEPTGKRNPVRNSEPVLRFPPGKQLKDFPFWEWFEAVDGCDFCGAKYQVRVTYVDDSGYFGDVEYRVSHAEDCAERFDEELNTAESIFDMAGWEFTDKPVTVLGKQFLPLKTRANIGPCLNCGKLVIGVPLILFIDEGRGGELDFCSLCFEKLGLWKELK